MTLFIEYPWAAIPVASACAALWLWRRQRVAGAAAFAWLLYAGYEYLMYTRVLCSGECNIRVDLLLIYPLLLLLTILGGFTTLRAGS